MILEPKKRKSVTISTFILLCYVLYPEKGYPLLNVSEIFPFHAEMCQTFLSHCHPSIKIWGSSLTLDLTLASVEQLGVTGNLVLWSVMGLDWLSFSATYWPLWSLTWISYEWLSAFVSFFISWEYELLHTAMSIQSTNLCCLFCADHCNVLSQEVKWKWKC